MRRGFDRATYLLTLYLSPLFTMPCNITRINVFAVETVLVGFVVGRHMTWMLFHIFGTWAWKTMVQRLCFVYMVTLLFAFFVRKIDAMVEGQGQLPGILLKEAWAFGRRCCRRCAGITHSFILMDV